MIQFPNNTVRPRTGNQLPAVRRRDEQQVEETLDRESLLPPPRRGFSSIPNDDVLQNLIERALTALKRGVVWDRGSILNIQT